MARLVREYTNFVTEFFSPNEAYTNSRRNPTIMLYGGHGRSLGLKACGVAYSFPICPVIVDNSPGAKATVVEGIDVEPQSSLARRPWKSTYTDGDVLALLSAIIITSQIRLGNLQRIIS